MLKTILIILIINTFVYADNNNLSFSLNGSLPDLIGIRVKHNNDTGHYYGFQSGLLMYLLTYIVNKLGDEIEEERSHNILFTPSVFIGSDRQIGNYTYQTSELNINILTKFVTDSKEISGSVLLTPRLGFMAKKGPVIGRLMIGLSFSLYSFNRTSNQQFAFPVLLTEFEYLFVKSNND